MAVPIEKRRDMDHQRAWLSQVINQLQVSGYYGVLEIKFQAGAMADVTQHDKKKLKPPAPGDCLSVPRPIGDT